MPETTNHPRDVIVIGRGIQPGHVRETNRRAILSVISLRPGISNAELARVTALAPQTVSAVLADLEAHGLVTRGEVVRGRRGQPATPLYMNPVGALAIGAAIGWRHLEVCLVGIGMQVPARVRHDYDYPDPARVLRELAATAAELIGQLAPIERARLVGMGLAAPGGLGNPGVLVAPPPGQQELWAGLDIAAEAAAATGLDVSLFNDGHAACWAQRVAYRAPRPLSFVFFGLDTLVGGGILAENRLWEGAKGTAASLGAMLVTDREGRMRAVDELASLHALEERLAAAGLARETAQNEPLAPPVRTVFEAWLGEAAEALAQALMNASRVMEFELAVIESALPKALTGEVVAATRQRMERFPTPGGPPPPPIVAGTLGRCGAAQGAALLRMHRRYFSRELAHMDI